MVNLIEIQKLKKLSKKYKGIEQGFFFVDFFFNSLNPNRNRKYKKGLIEVVNYETNEKYYFEDAALKIYYNQYLIMYYFDDIRYYSQLYSVFDKFRKKINNKFSLQPFMMAFLNFFRPFTTNQVPIDGLRRCLHEKLKLETVTDEMIDEYFNRNILIITGNNLCSLRDEYFFYYSKLVLTNNTEEKSFDLLVEIFPTLKNRNLDCFLKLLEFTDDEIQQDKIFISYDDYYNLDFDRQEPWLLTPEQKQLSIVMSWDKMLVNSYIFNSIVTLAFRNDPE